MKVNTSAETEHKCWNYQSDHLIPYSMQKKTSITRFISSLFSKYVVDMITTLPLIEPDVTCLRTRRKVFSEFMDYFFHDILFKQKEILQYCNWLRKCMWLDLFQKFSHYINIFTEERLFHWKTLKYCNYLQEKLFAYETFC